MYSIIKRNILFTYNRVVLVNYKYEICVHMPKKNYPYSIFIKKIISLHYYNL